MENAKDLYNRGNDLIKSGHYEKAIKSFANASELSPKNAAIFCSWGIALYKLAEEKRIEPLFMESCEKFADSMKIKPDYDSAYKNLKIALSGLDKIRQDGIFLESSEKHVSAFFNLGRKLCEIAEIKKDEWLLIKSCEKFADAVKIKPNYDSAYKNLENALSILNKIKQDELIKETPEKRASAFFDLGHKLYELAEVHGNKEWLLKESCEKYEKAAQIQPGYPFVFHNWGLALYDLGRNEHDKSLFLESCKKFAHAVKSDPNIAKNFKLWGTVLYDFAKIAQDKSLFKEAVYFLIKSKKDIFEKDVEDRLDPIDDKKDRKDNIQTKTHFLLDMDADDDEFYNETVKHVKDKTKLDEYRKVYNHLIYIINQLHVNYKNEKPVATYREKTISQEMLFNDSKFRLNAITHSNDPTEGKVLFNYLFEKNKRPTNESLMNEYGAFAGCFIFNHDSLNQFRLYGKEGGREGTGLSLVFRNSFFNEDTEDVLKQQKREEKLDLLRCIYIDPETRRVETVGHKEDYLFYRDREAGETDNEIQKKIDNYHKYIDTIIDNVRKKMEELKNSVQNLEIPVIGQLLLSLRYLTKHIAFKEEHECRIIRLCRLNRNKIETSGDFNKKYKIETSDDFNKIYIKYDIKVSDHVEKIIFGPKADGFELFRDILMNKNLEIPCEKSKNPLA